MCGCYYFSSFLFFEGRRHWRAGLARYKERERERERDNICIAAETFEWFLFYLEMVKSV